MTLRRGKLKRDFGAYAKMEAANIFLVPGLALWFGWPRLVAEIIAIGLAVAACAGLLLVGTIFWRAIDQRLKGGDTPAFDRAMAFADSAERPMAIVTVAASVAVAVAFVRHGATSAIIAAASLTLLAVLEYVNYYHRQLQVIDNLADFKRLFATRTFKRAHMARELAAYRSRRA